MITNGEEMITIVVSQSIGRTCEEALDTACGLYLSDPTAWT
jgi:hypothetical protein